MPPKGHYSIFVTIHVEMMNESLRWKMENNDYGKYMPP